MKKYLFSVSVLCMCLEMTAAQTFISGNDYSAMSSFDDFNVLVEEGAVVSLPGNTITMTGTVYLDNHGTLNGTIDTNEKILYVYNSGIINGNIDTTSGGSVIQRIRSDAEMTNITVVGGGFSVEVNDYQNANFNNIKNINADSFTIKKSSIIIDNFDDWQSWNKNVDLEGEVSLIINDAETVHSGEIVRHTANGDTVNVVIPNLDKMYKPELVLIGDNLVLNIVRETNYNLVFEEDKNVGMGAGLEAIRSKHGNHDKLLRALDSAENLFEIERIKGLSYRFNHDILLRPMKTINNFALFDVVKSETGIGIDPYYTFSNNLNGFGGRIYAGYENDILYFNAGLSVHRFDYSDKFNDFSGMSYALDMKSKQRINKFFLGEAVGFSLTDFRGDYVSLNNKLKNNPLGMSWFADVFTGYDFDVSSNIKITPNIGFAYQKYKVADISDNDYFAHVGTDIKYDFSVDGIKYEYSLSGGAGSNGDLFLTIGVGFLSITDEAGISAEAGVLKDEFNTHYKFSLNAKVLF